MPRALLAWSMLLTYLLVVGAGLRVGRPAPAFSAARPYVHSAHCQHDNMLRLDCFERCNGDQTRLTKQLPGESDWHFLAQLKGLDVHTLAAGASLAAPAGYRPPLGAPHPTWPAPAVCAGQAAGPDRPPCAA